MVQHSEELKDTFFSTSITQGIIINNKVRVDSAIVPSDVEAPGSSAVLLNYVDPWHEASYSNIVVRMLKEEQNVKMCLPFHYYSQNYT